MSADVRRRLKKFLISAELLADIIAAGPLRIHDGGRFQLVKSDFPKDAEIVHVEWDFPAYMISVICRSPSWEEVANGQAIPVFEPTMTMEVVEAGELLNRAGIRVTGNGELIRNQLTADGGVTLQSMDSPVGRR